MNEARFIRILKALSDPRRLRMVREIAGAGELSCGQIGARFHLSQPTISHHLKILADAGLIRIRRAGQQHFLSVDSRVIKQLTDFFPTRLTPSSSRT